MTHEEAMNDDFQVPNGFLPSDKKQSTMTQNTQGGIARREKALEILNKNIGAEVLGTFGETDTQWIVDAMIEFKELDESPLPASPEGTPFDKEGFKRWMSGWIEGKYRESIANYVEQYIFQPFQQENEFKRNMIADLDSMNERLKQENEKLKEELKEAYGRLNDITGSLTNSVDENFKLTEQLAEAREALGLNTKQMEGMRKDMEMALEREKKMDWVSVDNRSIPMPKDGQDFIILFDNGEIRRFAEDDQPFAVATHWKNPLASSALNNNVK